MLFMWTSKLINSLSSDEFETFGLGIFGDRETIANVPMINIPACSSGNPNCVLGVIDCTDHAIKEIMKGGFYICQTRLTCIRMIDLNKTFLI